MQYAIIYSGKLTTLSYNDDWLEAFLDYDLDIDKYNTVNMSIFKYFKLLFKYDYIILLHSTNSNGFSLNRFILKSNFLKYVKAKVLLFVGNEFKLMPQKVNFINKNKIAFIISQLPQDTAEWLYKHTNSKIISLPHALNNKVFNHTTDLADREIDIGNRSYEYPQYLGDIERQSTLEFLDTINSKFNLDISTDPNKRFNRIQWAEFLNSCKFTIATEAGSSYLERDDKTRKLVNKFLDGNPKVHFDEVYNKFFKNYKGDSISGKCISSRHFDAIGTKTCQILLEGRYNDILKPNEHYIELKKDFSNVDEVVEKMINDKLREEIVERAYKFAVNNHTHKHRIEYLLKEIIKNEYSCNNTSTRWLKRNT
jgi:spore maturation protein CgeB